MSCVKECFRGCCSGGARCCNCITNCIGNVCRLIMLTIARAFGLWADCLCRCISCAVILGAIVAFVVLFWSDIVFWTTEYQWVPPGACPVGWHEMEGIVGCVENEPTRRLRAWAPGEWESVEDEVAVLVQHLPVPLQTPRELVERGASKRKVADENKRVHL